MKSSAHMRWLAQMTLIFTALFFFVSPAQSQENEVEPVYVLYQFIASGFMGDTTSIELFESWQDVPYDSTDVDSFCVKISYTPRSVGWGGIYWQNRANNWGEYSGENYSEYGYQEITFWARGEKGGELVEFKAGDINDPKKPYRDSFRATRGRVRLTKQWKKYRISLKDKDMSSVIGGFAWVASGNAHPNGLTFYLDGVTYSTH